MESKKAYLQQNLDDKSLIEKYNELLLHYNLLIASSSQMVYEYDIIKGEIIWKGNTHEILGYSNEEMGDISAWEENIHINDRKRVVEELNSSIKKLSIFSINYKFKKKDGKYIFISDRGFYLSDSKGIAVKMIGMMQDINKQKITEDALKLSEIKYKSLFDNSVMGMYLTTFDGKLIIVNNALIKMLGYKNFEDIASLNLNEDGYADKEDRIKFIDNFKEKDELKGFESIWERKDRTEIYVRENAKAIKDNSGKILYFEGTVEDITELKNEQKINKAIYQISKLSHYNINLKEIYQKIHCIIGELMHANNFYIALHDKKENLISYPYFIDEYDFPPSPRQFQKGLTEYIITTGKNLLADKNKLKNLKKEGKLDVRGTMPLQWMATPLKVNNEIIGIIALQSYSTPNLFSENDLKILEFVSEQIATTINLRQINDDIIETQSKILESDQLKSSLLNNINHEIRTPMASILGYSEILKSKCKDGECNDIANNIYDSGVRLMKTLNSIIDYTQLISNQTQVRLVNANINEQLSDIINKYLIKTDNHNKVNISLSNNKVYFIPIDIYLFHQVINNLIDNAFKFSCKSQINISTNEITVNNKNYYEIKIKDFGIGISDKDQEIIFKEFRQASEGITRNYDGIGLGLAVSKKMALMMGGDINFVSQEGNGSSFSLLLPLSNQIKIDKSSVDKIEMKIRKIKSLPKLLIIEDDIINIELAIIYLKNFCNISYALNGKTALKLCEDDYFDIIISDINLENDFSGIDVVKNVRKNPKYKNTPFIAITGFTANDEVNNIFNAGFNYYLAKPFTSVEITELIKNIISNIPS